MEQYGEFCDGRNYTVFQLHQELTIEVLEQRMVKILRNLGIYSDEEIELYIDIGPFEGMVAYGVIRTNRGRILELHILNHPTAIDSALIGANGRNISSINSRNTTIH